MSGPYTLSLRALTSTLDSPQAASTQDPLVLQSPFLSMTPLQSPLQPQSSVLCRHQLLSYQPVLTGMEVVLVLSVCLDTTMEVISEPFACNDMTIEVIPEPFVCPVVCQRGSSWTLCLSCYSKGGHPRIPCLFCNSQGGCLWTLSLHCHGQKCHLRTLCLPCSDHGGNLWTVWLSCYGHGGLFNLYVLCPAWSTVVVYCSKHGLLEMKSIRGWQRNGMEYLLVAIKCTPSYSIATLSWTSSPIILCLDSSLIPFTCVSLTLWGLRGFGGTDGVLTCPDICFFSILKNINS